VEVAHYQDGKHQVRQEEIIFGTVVSLLKVKTVSIDQPGHMKSLEADHTAPVKVFSTSPIILESLHFIEVGTQMHLENLKNLN
jgi:hypothetical protein